MSSTMNTWNSVAPGVWKIVLGQPSAVTPLSLLRTPPALAALVQMGEEILPKAAEHISATINSKQTIVTMPLTEKEQIYGLGLQFMRMNHRGFTRVLRVNSDPKQDTGETHAPVPFYISNEGYGVLINTCSIVTAGIN